MSHYNRQAAARKAATHAQEVAEQMGQLGDLDRWYTTRLIKAKKVASKLVDSLNEALKTELNVDQTTPTTDVASQTAAPADVVVPVESVVRTTAHGATVFKTPGLVGGYFNGTYKNGYRPNNERAIPNREIVRGFDPLTKTVKVNRKWFMEPTQEDLRNYTQTVK